MIIPEHRLEAIEGLVVAMGMSVAEQRELVRAYRERELLRDLVREVLAANGMPHEFCRQCSGLYPLNPTPTWQGFCSATRCASEHPAT